LLKNFRRLPSVFIPQKNFNLIENTRITKLDNNGIIAIILINCVIGEAAVEVIIHHIAIEQRRLELAFDHNGVILVRRNVLIGIQDAPVLELHVFGLVLELNRIENCVRGDQIRLANVVEELFELHQRQPYLINELALDLVRLSQIVQLVPFAHQMKYIQLGRTERVSRENRR